MLVAVWEAPPWGMERTLRPAREASARCPRCDHMWWTSSSQSRASSEVSTGRGEGLVTSAEASLAFRRCMSSWRVERAAPPRRDDPRYAAGAEGDDAFRADRRAWFQRYHNAQLSSYVAEQDAQCDQLAARRSSVRPLPHVTVWHRWAGCTLRLNNIGLWVPVYN